MVLVLLLFFFFNQKQAYDMRINDWSSDVCSSDLFSEPFEIMPSTERASPAPCRICCAHSGNQPKRQKPYFREQPHLFVTRQKILGKMPPKSSPLRSEERREGKECVSKFRSRGSLYK